MTTEVSSPSLTVVLHLDATPALLAAIGAIAATLGHRAPSVEPATISPPAETSATEQPDEAVNIPSAKKKAGEWISEARDEVIRALFPVGTLMGEIEVRVNMIPGPRASTSVIRQRAYFMGLARPEGFNSAANLEKLARMREGKVALRAGAMPENPPPVGPTQTDRAAAVVVAGGAAVLPAPPVAPPREPDVLPPAAADPPPASDASLGARARIVSAKPAAQDVPPMPRPVPQRKSADREQIRSFCEARGLQFDKFDIDAINKRLEKLGHPGFTLIDPLARRYTREQAATGAGT